MSSREIPIEAAIALNELQDKIAKQTGLPIVSVQLVPPPQKSEISWMSDKAREEDRFMIAQAFIVAGVECLMLIAPKEAAHGCPWDCWAVTREGGYQMWPAEVNAAFEIPYGDDLNAAATSVMHGFLKHFPGEARFLAWIKACDEMNAVENHSSPESHSSHSPAFKVGDSFTHPEVGPATVTSIDDTHIGYDWPGGSGCCTIAYATQSIHSPEEGAGQ